MGLALMAPAPALAAGPTLSIALKPGLLSDALQDLSIRSRTGVLFSPDVVSGRRSPPLTGTMTLEQALDRLLDGADLAYRRTPTGSYVIYAVPRPDPPVALPEILVVGARTQNADIRRTENDIQPYQVFGSRELGASQADNVDQFLRSRLTNNAELQSPSQDPATELGTNRSEVNLHGLGPKQTLILVDGGRMPAIPNIAALEMRQPDINGVPLLAIDRVETLTATAGGIYGPGATGGVINVILKRDYRGADLALTYGVTARGDAPRRRIDGRIGVTPDHGRTDIMFTFSRAEGDALPLGNRDYADLAREILIAQDPVAFLNGVRTANAIIVRDLYGDPLVLSKALGGANLGSSFTYLPIGRSGGAGDLAAVLTANAGQVPRGLSPDGSGAERGLTSDTKVTSVLLNVRRKFGDHVEAFVDLLGYQNDGVANLGQMLPNSTVASSFSADNPFAQSVVVQFPAPGFKHVGHNRLRTYRLSSGVIVRLPFDWKADATYTRGGVRSSLSSVGQTLDLYGYVSGTSGVAKPPLDPFGDWAAFSQALQAYAVPVGIDFSAREHFHDASLRLAGPLWSTPAGPITLSVLVERRSEVVPTYGQTITYPMQAYQIKSPGFTQVVRSVYGEVRAPIFDRDTGPRLFRGLELQLAARYDDNRTQVPDTSLKTWLTSSQDATAYTAGFRIYPYARLMLRGSVSTGILPPTAAQIIPNSSLSFGGNDAPDPKRGGQPIGSEGRFTLLSSGSLTLEPEKARALSFGVVVNPEGGSRPRVSIDYTQIIKTNEIIQDFSGVTRYFMANESLFPERVTRAPLTDADRAAGFTGGVVTRVDASFLNVGRTRSDAIDLKADHSLWVGDLGRLQLYGTATWQPRLTRRTSPDRPKHNYAGFADGPARWRGNIGAVLNRGPFSISANGQYYAGYKSVSYPGTIAPTVLEKAATQGPGVAIPSQVYLDTAVAYAFKPRGPFVQGMEARLGVQNLLDHRPPTATNTELGYSFYGDPRRRRLELSLRARF